MQYVNHSSYLVSIGAIAIGSCIYIHETTVKLLPQIVRKAVSEHKNTKIFCREQLIKHNQKCCPPTFHDLPTPL